MQRLFNNFGLKLVSVGLAVLLWAYVYLYINYPATQVLTLPLKVKGIASGMMLLTMKPQVDTVQLRIRGPYRSIRQLIPGKYAAVLDCTSLTAPGEATLRIQVPDFGDMSVTDQTPTFIDVVLVEKISRNVHVAIHRSGSVAPGFVIQSEVLGKTMVAVSGPKPQVVKISVARIEPDVQGLREALHSEETVVLYDRDGQRIDSQLIEISPAELTYSMQLVPAGNVRLLEIIPQYTGLPSRDSLLVGISLYPQSVAVDASLVPPGVQAIRTSAVKLSGADESFSTSLDLVYPFALPRGSALPRKCEAFVEIEPLNGELDSAVRLIPSLVGRAAGLEYLVSPPELVLRSRDLALLSDAARKTIRAELDVAKLTPGEYRLVPQLILPLELDQATIYPNSVTITVLQTKRSR